MCVASSVNDVRLKETIDIGPCSSNIPNYYMGNVKNISDEEYEKLVKSRFKELFDEDVQKLINRRFRKYKILEERYKLLEESLKEKEDAMTAAEKRIADFDERLRSEVEKAAENAEKSVLERLKARKLRPGEVGIAPRKTASPFDVSGLSRKERADLARRAAGGEKIKL